MMPKIAQGDANKVWIVPSEIGRALEGLGSTMNSLRGIPDDVDGPRKRVDMGSSVPTVPEDRTLQTTHDEVAAAIAAAEASSNPHAGREALERDGASRAEPATGTGAASGAPSDASGPGDPGEPPAQ
jgi:hypothetical protein